jgi:hypothetical protein
VLPHPADPVACGDDGALHAGCARVTGVDSERYYQAQTGHPATTWNIAHLKMVTGLLFECPAGTVRDSRSWLNLHHHEPVARPDDFQIALELGTQLFDSIQPTLASLTWPRE